MAVRVAKELKVGDEIFRFDVNRRVYDRSKGSGPIYAEHFSGYRITGETPRSWLVKACGHESKVNKKTLKEAGRNGFGGYQWFTQHGMEDNIWVNDHRPDLGREVMRCYDADKLRKIRSILDGKE